MKKNVVIIEPASSSANVFSFFSYLPLMGPLYLGTLLKQNGFNVRVINENTVKRGVTDAELNADHLILSCLTPTVNRGYEIAKKYKSLNPNGLIYIGGPHVTFQKEEAARFADHVCLGEGENIIVDLLKYGSTEKFIQGSPVENLDSLPLVDWSILKNHEKGSITPIMTSRGCPFACNFCSVAEMYGRRFRAMSAERVLEDFKLADKRYVFFYDDNFTANRGRAHEIVDGLIAVNNRKAWTSQVRADVTKDLDLVEKMAASGCERVYIGFESVDSNTLKKLKKSQTPEDIAYSVEKLHEHGIKVHGMFMFGADSDTKTVAVETDAFVKANKVDSVQYMILTPLPGTELFRQMESDNRLMHRNWEHYDGLHVVFWPKEFTPFDLQRLSMETFRSFYSLANAANEILNLFGDNIVRGFDWLTHKSRKHTYSFKNALIKAGGKLILNKWHRINASYMNYLYKMSAPRVSR